MEKIKCLKSWTTVVFAFLIITRVFLWLTLEWPHDGNIPLEAQQTYKVSGLPLRFMVYWPDSGRYWPLAMQTFSENLAFLQNMHQVGFLPQYLFYTPIRILTENIAFGVLAQNILSLLTAVMLYIMLRPIGKGVAALTILFTFGSLLTLSLEYALLRAILTRFLVISFLFLVWRMIFSPNGKLCLATSGILFLLLMSRPEMILIFVIFAPIIYFKFERRFAQITLAGGLLSLTLMFLHSQLPESSKVPPAGLLLQTLVAEAYDYQSPHLGDLPQRIYAQAKQCEKIFIVKCNTPPYSRYQYFENLRNKTILNYWAKENKTVSPSEELHLAELYVDILKNNTRYVFYSVLYSLSSYFSGKMDTTSPLIYAGDNPNYINGWPYYTSYSVFSFGDPLSELSDESPDKGPKWLRLVLAPFSEQWMRRFCAPFFFIGIFFAFRKAYIRSEQINLQEKEFWRLALPFILVILPAMSVIGVRNSRYFFYLDPLIFACSALGMREAWRILFQLLLLKQSRN